MSWAMAFHDVGIAVCVTVGILGFFYLLYKANEN